MTLAVDEKMSTDARMRVMAARIIAQQRWPYLSSLLFSLRIVEASPGSLDTMAVDRGWRMYYAPSFVMSETPEALATVVLHEALHCLYEHAARFESLHQADDMHPLWNIAGDIGINEVLDGAKMPWTALQPVRMHMFLKYGITADLPTEGMFFRLLDHAVELAIPNDCGSVSAGHARGYELPAQDAENPAARADHQQIIRDRVAQDILQSGSGIGSAPGNLQRWAQDRLSPKLPWRRILAGYIRRDLAMIAGRRDYSYMRPSRRQEALRQSGSTVVLPAMRQPAPPRVAVVVDTSGSIGRQQLNEFVAEVMGIARAAGVTSPTRVISCDAVAYPAFTVRSMRDIEEMQLQGGGGTDMGQGLLAAAALQPRPDVVVVFTDGLTPWPAEMPSGITSVIVAIQKSWGDPEVPTWCTSLTLSDA